MNTDTANSPQARTAGAQMRTEVRRFASRFLPTATVPSRFVLLDELPRLANGKIDRKALAQLRTDESTERTFVAPKTASERLVADLWCELLNLTRVGANEDFFELGGDSLTTVRMVARLNETTGQKVAMREFFSDSTLAGLARLLDGGASSPNSGASRSLEAERLHAEAELPVDVQIDGLAEATHGGGAVFLTGVTGYTGAFLLRSFLDGTTAPIYVLVRADNNEEALIRVEKALQRFGIARPEDRERLRPLRGDLSLPYFGLRRADYERVANDAEMIVHNGALSSYSLTYHQLKPVNVLGTIEVLRLATHRRLKAVHYVSSLGIFPSVPGAPCWPETRAEQAEGVLGGYRQSKWVGDSLIHQAGDRGVPFTVYRPGLITGATDSGVCATDTFINAAILGCIQLGVTFPFQAPIEVTPVDYFAKAVAHVALSAAPESSTLNVPGARTMAPPELFERVRQYGFKVDNIPYVEWYRRLSASLDAGEENALARFLPLFEEEQPSNEMGYQGALPTYAAKNFKQAVAGLAQSCPEPDMDLWRVYLDWLVDSGFLPSVEEQHRRLGVNKGAR